MGRKKAEITVKRTYSSIISVSVADELFAEANHNTGSLHLRPTGQPPRGVQGETGKPTI